MKIYYISALTTKSQKNVKQNINKIVTANGHSLVASNFLQSKTSKTKDPETNIEDVRQSIAEADGLIIEATNGTFELGLLTTLALLSEKPVLCLSSDKDYSNLLKARFFYFEKYKDNKELQLILENYLRMLNNIQFSIRFNLRLKPEHRSYLETSGRKKRKSASEIIRDLIENDMGKKNSKPTFSLTR